ncbi:hypothetical protein ScPMuIL_002801 [Solemya velum]
MECFSRIGQVVIVVLNIIFLLLSVALIIAGLLAKFAREVLDPLISTAEKKLNDLINIQLSGLSDLSLDLTKVLTTLAIVLTVLGVVFAVISLLGCCGACCQMKAILLIYGVVLVIILIAEAVVVGLFFGSPETLKDPIKSDLKTGLVEYEGLKGKKLVSMGWNVAMLKFQCCGIDDYQDFKDSEAWNTTATALQIDMPLACCKTNVTNFTPACARMSSNENNRKQGCLDKIWNELANNKPLAYGIACGTLAFELILIIFTLKLFFENDNSVNPIG